MRLSILILLTLLSPFAAYAYPYWQSEAVALPVILDAPTDDALVQYHQQKLALDCNDIKDCFDFYQKHFESGNERIAKDAFAYFATLPYDRLKEHVALLSLRLLRKHAANRRVPPVRRDFYAFLLGLRKQHADRKLIAEMVDQFLLPKNRQQPMVGVLAAYALSGSSYAHAMFLKVLRATASESQHPSDVLAAVVFLHKYEPDIGAAWLPKIVARALGMKEQQKVLAIAIATQWQLKTVADQVVKLYAAEKSSEEIKSLVLGYCELASDHKGCASLLESVAPKESPEVLEETPEVQETY